MRHLEDLELLPLVALLWLVSHETKGLSLHLRRVGSLRGRAGLAGDVMTLLINLIIRCEEWWIRLRTPDYGRVRSHQQTRWDRL